MPVTVLSGFGSSADLEKVIFQLPIIIEAEPLVRVFDGIVQLARKYDLSTYDAAYLDLAMRIGLPLTTQDDKLRRVALLCGVEFFKNF
ncbi:type II toxin-antitoxin system VapC family toxin [Atrimonas thermophila]|uniref:type II toxin-antitoxin system VapC family toxin n=1 Tax=Atrimonas thermophila TaxID=3064161 RepID=UPI00399D2FE1